MKCPKCGNSKRFDVGGWAVESYRWDIELNDNATDFDIMSSKWLNGDHHTIDPTAEVICRECGLEGALLLDFSPKGSDLPYGLPEEKS
jgi:DNA-directed RNA polymerase subunit M/transcription elongation factor TFIIS